eukprot:357697-Chlamydomonas_euryale.AAC.1
MSNQTPGAASNPHLFAIRAPSTAGSSSTDHQLQQGRAILLVLVSTVLPCTLTRNSDRSLLAPSRAPPATAHTCAPAPSRAPPTTAFTCAPAPSALPTMVHTCAPAPHRSVAPAGQLPGSASPAGPALRAEPFGLRGSRSGQPPRQTGQGRLRLRPGAERGRAAGACRHHRHRRQRHLRRQHHHRPLGALQAVQ